MGDNHSGNVSSWNSLSPSASADQYRYKFHLNNIQLLAAIDCALGVTSLVFDCRQLILAVDSVLYNESETVLEDEGKLNTQMIIASVASVFLTLTQLVLACLTMISLSNRDTIVSERTKIISGIWVTWSGILLVVLIVYVLNMKRFEDIGEKFYLFMLMSEILFRTIIISYGTAFFVFGCKCSSAPQH